VWLSAAPPPLISNSPPPLLSRSPSSVQFTKPHTRVLPPHPLSMTLFCTFHLPTTASPRIPSSKPPLPIPRPHSPVHHFPPFFATSCRSAPVSIGVYSFAKAGGKGSAQGKGGGVPRVVPLPPPAQGPAGDPLLQAAGILSPLAVPTSPSAVTVAVAVTATPQASTSHSHIAPPLRPPSSSLLLCGSTARHPACRTRGQWTCVWVRVRLRGL
jgi:hypothetical protein